MPRKTTLAPVCTPRNLDRRFRAALCAYVASEDDMLLGQAYELGRSAMAAGLTIPEVVALHGKALNSIVGKPNAHRKIATTLSFAALFLGETLSSFEMTHRGYHEALAALRHLNETLEKEVKRIAHALHDEAGQLLVSVHLAVAELEQDLQPSARERLRRVNELIDRVEDQLRDLSHELRPTVLDDLGWLPALEFLAESISRRARLRIAVRSKVTTRLSIAAETALYRVVQEALANVVRHARAGNVHIDVTASAGTLVCDITDDGVGFDPAKEGRTTGLGLRGMRERLNAIGGRAEILTAPGKGTRVHLELPMVGA